MAAGGSNVAIALVRWAATSQRVSLWQSALPALDAVEATVLHEDIGPFQPPPPCDLTFASVDLRGSEVLVAASFAASPTESICHLAVASGHAWIFRGASAAALAPAGNAQYVVAALGAVPQGMKDWLVEDVCSRIRSVPGVRQCRVVWPWEE